MQCVAMGSDAAAAGSTVASFCRCRKAHAVHRPRNPVPFPVRDSRRQLPLPWHRSARRRSRSTARRAPETRAPRRRRGSRPRCACTDRWTAGSTGRSSRRRGDPRRASARHRTGACRAPTRRRRRGPKEPLRRVPFESTDSPRPRDVEVTNGRRTAARVRGIDQGGKLDYTRRTVTAADARSEKGGAVG